MSKFAQSVERHHRLIITVQALIIVLVVASCTFHEVLPICHYVFGCDHGMHGM